MQILAQIIGVVAMVYIILAYQRNNRIKMLTFMSIANLFFTVHFAILGAYTGASMSAVNILRNYIFSKKYTKKWASSKIWLFIFAATFIFAGLYTYKNIYSIFPIIAMVSGTIAFWMKNPTSIRLICLISPPSWLVYNIHAKSIAGVLTEIFILTSILIAIYRYDIKKVTNKKS